MMNKIALLSILIISSLISSGQKYTAEKSSISFFSDAAIEDITAENVKGASVFNSASGDIAFSIPIAEFQFAKSLMQEHFNEKYMDSEKYPKATFQGKITGFDPNATSIQNVKAGGELAIHGQKNAIDVPGTIEKLGEKLVMKSKFIVKLEDYKIKIPQLMWQNIAEQVEVTVEFTYKPQ